MDLDILENNQKSKRHPLYLGTPNNIFGRGRDFFSQNLDLNDYMHYFITKERIEIKEVDDKVEGQVVTQFFPELKLNLSFIELKMTREDDVITCKVLKQDNRIFKEILPEDEFLKNKILKSPDPYYDSENEILYLKEKQNENENSFIIKQKEIKGFLNLLYLTDILVSTKKIKLKLEVKNFYNRSGRHLLFSLCSESEEEIEKFAEMVKKTIKEGIKNLKEEASRKKEFWEL